MVRRCLFWGGLLAVGLLASRNAPAAQIKFTGNVENDFAIQPGNSLVVDFPFPQTPGSTDLPQSNPGDVAIPSWMSTQGRQTGLNIKDLRLHFDRVSDTVYVGVNFFGIAGDIDGDGNPGGTDPQAAQRGGVDQPNLSGRESIVVGFDLNNDRQTDVVAGIPVQKTGSGVDNFRVSKYVNNGLILPYGFGDDLTSNNGGLAFNPSADHPDFEFTIKNFSKLPEFNPLSDSFGVTAYAGSLDAIIIGEDMVQYTAVSPQVIVPEPASVLAWGLALAGGAAWHLRLRGRKRDA